jgi:hypothetical protein
MLRAISLFGMAGLFLLISPKLRRKITDGLGSATHQFELYTPYSYVGGILLVLVISLYRGAQPT